MKANKLNKVFAEYKYIYICCPKIRLYLDKLRQEKC